MSLEIYEEKPNSEQLRAEIFVKAAQNKDMIKEWALADASQQAEEDATRFAYMKGVETAVDFLKRAFEENGLNINVDVQAFEKQAKNKFEEIYEGENTPEEFFEAGYKLVSILARQNF